MSINVLNKIYSYIEITTINNYSIPINTAERTGNLLKAFFLS
jgi:hypothetical protein